MEKTETTINLPFWALLFREKYLRGIAHAFILHFNVKDYAIPGIRIVDFVGKIHSKRTVVAFYNPSQGITFLHPSMKADFISLLKLEAKPDPTLAELGLVTDQPEVELPRRPDQALPLLERLLKIKSSKDVRIAAVIIEYPEMIAPASDIATMSLVDRVNLVSLARWGTDPLIEKAHNPVFLVTENLNDLHPTLRTASNKWEAIEIKLPDFEARKGFISFAEEQYDFETQIGIDDLASMTAGLSLVHIEDIFLRAETENILKYEMVRERKQDIIASEFGEVLEIIEPTSGFEMIGGLELIKDFFKRSVIKPIHEGRTNRVPMGVLMTGPAGTGKSIMAEALAKEAGINMVHLNLARIFGKYVGQSERNLEKAIRAIESLAPCIVFMDEIDQSIQRGSSADSGVSNRVFKRLMEFMSQTRHRGRVVFLAATNRPDLMDAALRRPGRFDKKIPFLIPGKKERKAIFEVMICKYGGQTQLDIPGAAINETNGWTGAEIEAAVVKAIELEEDETMPLSQALVKAVQRIRPSTADIEMMTRLAIQETNDLDLLPEEFDKMRGVRRKLEEMMVQKSEKEA